MSRHSVGRLHQQGSGACVSRDAFLFGSLANSFEGFVHLVVPADSQLNLPLLLRVPQRIRFFRGKARVAVFAHYAPDDKSAAFGFSHKAGGFLFQLL
jgi:hypothetical protein